MATIGQAFREARERAGVTASKAAAATRLKVQHIEAMERDDFSVMAAPAYAKGFIRIYAEYLGLDPKPLLQEYQDLHAPKERTPLVSKSTPPKTRQILAGNFSRIFSWAKSVPRARARRAAIGLAAVLALALLVTGLLRSARSCAGLAAQPASGDTAAAAGILQEPPEPHVDDLAPAAPPEK